MTFAIRDAQDTDHPRILALNLESEEMLSPVDAARLRQLDTMAAYHRVVCEGDEVVAFLLAFREGVDYDSPNYRWFAARYPRFLYVDRVVVASSHQGRKLGPRLYRDLFDFARAQAVEAVTCEFYTVPPNEASRRFHAGFGFREVGTQWVADGRKQVSLQVASA
ncbi:GNAT family N-acetyltransferase [Lysobacter sp. LF1]|uniref:GNAT family N-acetyltransferase n=1 Tax=Lysobacter stagni TaxID=3045172 RepID=A0ABT6XDI1_9GAMM|nr:GNAT family N-acetyltransferase [Lysobacter sp. LF1]MDI9238200.1 GNAT family N-acetyltransferase [Lysobacter sp. LF1]